MAYDDELVDRIRAELADEPALTEQRMFGGHAFLIAGNLAVAGSSRGLMVRVDPKRSAELVAASGARPMVMRGRPMAGWLTVRPEVLAAPGAVA